MNNKVCFGCAAQEATFEDAAAEEFAVLNAHKAEDGPAATAHQNLDTGVVDLDIDVSVLGMSRPPPLVIKLLGANWQVRFESPVLQIWPLTHIQGEYMGYIQY